MFLNHYECPECSHEWTDAYECQVDDDCPKCGCRHISPHKSEDHVPTAKMEEVRCVLEDDEGGSIETWVSIGPTGILFRAKDHPDHGCSAEVGTPLMIDYVSGQLRVMVWSNINQEDPTHIISLAGAHVSNRKEEPDVASGTIPS